MYGTINIKDARLHNLKNVDLSIPKGKLVIFTGVSGSGKSTLALDTLHREGQRLYLESLGMVDYVSKPDVDRIEGLSPSISVEQCRTNVSPRSTVGTATEVFTYLRVLFARIGHRPCPRCGADIPRFKRHFPEVKAPATVAGGNFEGVVTNILRRYADQSHGAEYREKRTGCDCRHCWDRA